MNTPDPIARDGEGGTGPPPRSRRRQSLLGGAAVVMGVAAVIAAVVIWQGRDLTPDSGADFEAPVVAESGTESEVLAPSASATDEPARALPAIPVASGLLDEIPAARATPVRLSIPSLDVSAEVRPVGYDGTAMEVPRDAESIGWFRFGAVPGEPGSAVLAGHVTWHGDRGPFFALGDLESGAEIHVEFSDGRVARFAAVSRATYAKPDLPTAQLFAQDIPPVLHLITCGGYYDRSSRSYDDNVVVTAVVADGGDPVYGATS